MRSIGSAPFFQRPDLSESELDSTTITYQLAFFMYDADDQLINGMAVSPVPGTETRLTADAEEGQLEIRVEGAPWERKIVGGGTPYDAIAFDVKGDYSDLPNPASYLIESITEEGDGAVVRLRKPLLQSYPAGTLVRQHANAEVMQVTAEALPEWTESFVEVSGSSEPGEVAMDKFGLARRRFGWPSVPVVGEPSPMPSTCWLTM